MLAANTQTRRRALHRETTPLNCSDLSEASQPSPAVRAHISFFPAAASPLTALSHESFVVRRSSPNISAFASNCMDVTVVLCPIVAQRTIVLRPTRCPLPFSYSKLSAPPALFSPTAVRLRTITGCLCPLSASPKLVHEWCSTGVASMTHTGPLACSMAFSAQPLVSRHLQSVRASPPASTTRAARDKER
jgi:hypothetical protein